MKNIKRNEEEYYSILLEELDFLILMCNLFDNGKFECAKKISLSLRILLYNTGKGKCLLSYISTLKKISFYTPIKKEVAESKYLFYIGMVCPLDLKLNNEKILPIFVPCHYSDDSEMFYSKLRFNDWWKEKIIIAEDYSLSRYEIIKYMANQDGGAHVDEYIHYKYNKVANNIYGFLSLQLDENILINRQYLHYAIIRQIAHEVILSIKDEFKINIDYEVNWDNVKNKSISTLWLTNLSMYKH